jgi:DNA-binding CsgD family transcriptional regulator
MQPCSGETTRFSLFRLPYPIYEVDSSLRVFWANTAGQCYAGGVNAPVAACDNALCSMVLHCAHQQAYLPARVDACRQCELREAVLAADANAFVRRMVDLKRSDTNGGRDLKVLISASKIQDSDRVLLSVEEIEAIPGLRFMAEELEHSRKEMTELRATIGVLLEKHGQVRREFQDTITLNLRKTVIPCLDKLESSALTADQYQCVSLLRRRLSDIVSPFLRAAALLSIHLTQKEAQVADLIRQGKKTLEIASLLGCSKRAVEFHRDSLRKKLKIKNRKANLRQVLLKIGPCSEYV